MCMYDFSSALPSLSGITISPHLVWIGFYILVGIVAVITIILTWHWKTYHPKPSTAYIATALFSIVTAFILIGIASMIPKLFI